jgi:hypothetical protein
MLDGQAKQRLLPAYYSYNYISLLAGESRTVTIEVYGSVVKERSLSVALRGWNTAKASVRYWWNAKLIPAADHESP